jgi:hypothetical protein
MLRAAAWYSSVWNGMNCQPTTNTIAASAPVLEPRMFWNGPNSAASPKYGSSSRFHINATAALDNSSGRKKIDDRIARLRCGPAAHTPSSSAMGVCVAQPSAVSRSVVFVASRIRSSLNSRTQLSNPAAGSRYQARGRLPRAGVPCCRGRCLVSGAPDGSAIVAVIYAASSFAAMKPSASSSPRNTWASASSIGCARLRSIAWSHDSWKLGASVTMR